MKTPITASVPKVTGRHQYWIDRQRDDRRPRRAGRSGAPCRRAKRTEATTRKMPTERLRSVMSWWIVRETWR